jgi:hypothetical protein
MTEVCPAAATADLDSAYAPGSVVVVRDEEWLVESIDANGRLLPNAVVKAWKAKGDAITEAERTATNQADNTYTYEPPFALLDRETDMRHAHAHFTRLAEERP